MAARAELGPRGAVVSVVSAPRGREVDQFKRINAGFYRLQQTDLAVEIRGGKLLVTGAGLGPACSPCEVKTEDGSWNRGARGEMATQRHSGRCQPRAFRTSRRP